MNADQGGDESHDSDKRGNCIHCHRPLAQHTSDRPDRKTRSLVSNFTELVPIAPLEPNALSVRRGGHCCYPLLVKKQNATCRAALKVIARNH